MSSRPWSSWAWPQTIWYALCDAGALVWHRENLVQQHPQGLGLLYLLGGMGLGWWAYTIAPDVLSVLRFGTVGVVQVPTRHALLACSGVALITGVWGMVAAPAWDNALRCWACWLKACVWRRLLPGGHGRSAL